jgi:hypothetical protein
MKLPPLAQKSLAFLVHPVGLAAFLVLIINDLILRRLAPSFWTGKISDAAWLLLIPWLLAFCLSWVFTDSHCERKVFWVSFGGVAFFFLFVKTSVWGNLLATRIFGAFLNARPNLSLDPTDLIVLPSLFFSAWFWLRFHPDTISFTLSTRIKSAFLFPFALMILYGDAAAPDTGIHCFVQDEQKIIALSGYQSYQSQDGGLTWQKSLNHPADCSAPSTSDGWTMVDGSSPDLQLRYQPGSAIQSSIDHGTTWKTEFTFPKMGEAKRIYIIRSQPGNPLFLTGPLAAIMDPPSGNVLFAMGLQGILLRTPDGEWLWPLKDTYPNFENYPTLDAFFLMLGGVFFQGLCLALIIFCSLGILEMPPSTKNPSRAAKPIRISILSLAALAWLAVDGLFPPATSLSYSSAFAGIGLLASGILILGLTIEMSIRLARRAPYLFPRLIVSALGGGFLFLIPYLLWFVDFLPDYNWATIFALAFAITAAITGKLAGRRATIEKLISE